MINRQNPVFAVSLSKKASLTVFALFAITALLLIEPTQQSLDFLFQAKEYNKKSYQFQTTPERISKHMAKKSSGFDFIENPLCSTCKTYVSTLDNLAMNRTIEFALEAALSYVCGVYVLDWETCWGMARSMGRLTVENAVEFILSPNYVCEEIIPVCQKKDYELLEPADYVSRILSTKPDQIKGDDYINNAYKQISEDTSPRKTIKLVQFTDLHLDLSYAPGTSKQCGTEVLGCRDYCGYPEDPLDQSPKYGWYGCDLPLITFELMNKFIVEELKPDAIFWTGDVPPHDMWNYNLEFVQMYQSVFTQQMLLQLGNNSFYPLEGNHDFGEANNQDFTQQDPMIQFNLNAWSQWLDEDAKVEYAQAGYYSQKLKLSDGTVMDKVRVIALNTQTCYQFNFYLWSTRDDPANELQWLENTLLNMEAKGEIGIIISHVPPGDTCLYQWAIRYKAILDRFQHIIRFSMYGHAHIEHFGVQRGFNTGNSIGVGYWTGSVSTYSAMNPSFRVFEVDAQTMLPIKAHTYVFNVSEQEPKWHWDHEFTEFYNMTDLSPKSHDQLASNFLENESLAQSYMNTKTQQVVVYDQCDEDCRLKLYCQTRNAVYFDIKDCMSLKRIDMKNDPMSSFLEIMADPWYETLSTIQ